MSAHPSAGVPLVPKPVPAASTSQFGQDARDLGLGAGMAGSHPLDISRPASTTSTACTGATQRTMHSTQLPMPDPELLRQQDQMRLNVQASELVQSLQATEQTSQTYFHRVTPEDIVKLDQAEVYPAPALYFTKDLIQNLQLKVTIVPQREDDLLFRKPRTGKGALLLQKVLDEKEATLRQLQRVRAEYDKLSRASQLRAAASAAANAVAAAAAATTAVGDVSAAVAAARAATIEANTNAELNRLKSQAAMLQSRIDALTEQSQAAAESAELTAATFDLTNPGVGSGRSIIRSDDGRGVSMTIRWQEKIFAVQEMLKYGYAALMNQSNASRQIRTGASANDADIILERYESQVAEMLSNVPVTGTQPSSDGSVVPAAPQPLASWDDVYARTSVLISQDQQGMMANQTKADIRISTVVDSDLDLDPSWLLSHAMVGPVTDSVHQEFNPLAQRVLRQREFSKKRVRNEDGDSIDPEDADAEGVELFYVMAHIGVRKDISSIRSPADLAKARLGHEHALCCVRAYPNGTFDTIPPLSPPQDVPGAFDPSQWYYFRTPDGSHYRYRIELASAPLSEARMAALEFEIVTLLMSKYRHVLPASLSPVDAVSADLLRAANTLAQAALGAQQPKDASSTALVGPLSRQAEDRKVAAVELARLAAIKARREAALREREEKVTGMKARIQRAGTEFSRPPPSGSLRYTLLGEIAAASGFEESRLMIEWRLRMPDSWSWSPADDDCRSGSTTHTAEARSGSGLRMTALRSEAHPLAHASDAGYAAPSGATQHGVEGAAHRLPAPSAVSGRPGLTFQTRSSLESVYAHGGDYAITDGDAPSFEAELGLDDVDEYEDQPGGEGERGILNQWCCCTRRAVASQEHLIGHPLEIELVHRSAALEEGARRLKARKRLVEAIKDPSTVTQSELNKILSAAAMGCRLVEDPLCDSAPMLLFTAFSVGSFSRHRVASNGFVHLPTTPGSHVLKVRTWRPVGSIYSELSSFFIGGGPRLADPVASIAYPDKAQAKKMGLTGRAGGWVDMKEGGGPVDVAARREARARLRAAQEEKRRRRAERRQQRLIKQEAAEGIALLRKRRGQDPGAAGRIDYLSDDYETESSEATDEDDDEQGRAYREDLEEELWLESALVDDAISRRADIARLQSHIQANPMPSDDQGPALGTVSPYDRAAILRSELASNVKSGADAVQETALGAAYNPRGSDAAGSSSAAEPALGSSVWRQTVSPEAMSKRQAQVQVLETTGGLKVSSPSTFVSWTGEVRDLVAETEQAKTLRGKLHNPAIPSHVLGGYANERALQTANQQRRERERFQSVDPDQVIFFNKYGLYTEPAGTITLMLNVVFTVPDDIVTPNEGFNGLPGLENLSATGISSLLGDALATTSLGAKTGATQGGKLSSMWHLTAQKALERRKMEARLAADTIKRGAMRFGLTGRERALSNWRRVKALLPLIRELRNQ